MQGEMFDDVPDAPREPEFGSSFRSALGQVAAGARAAIAARQQADEVEAAEAERLAELDAADANRNLEVEASQPAPAPEPLPSAEVIPLRRAREPKNDGRGDFFAIDHRLWAKVCGLGLNAAVAYLVLARGSGGDNRTTSWSVNAIEKRTNISRDKAAKAIKTLQLAGLIDKGGSPRRPRYFIEPMSRAGSDMPSPLSDAETKLLSAFRGWKADGLEPDEVPETARRDAWMGLTRPRQVAYALVKHGLLEHFTGGWFGLTRKGELSAEDGDWTWLPNLLVDPMEGAASPIERVRQSQFLPALRLFIDMYHAHDLRGGKGIDWRAGKGLRGAFEKKKIGENGIYVVWGFKRLHSTVWAEGPIAGPHHEPKKAPDHLKNFWKALEILTDAGLVADVPHLVESNDYRATGEKGDTSESGEVIHPLPFRSATYRARGLAHPEELAITAAAEAACQRMVSPSQWASAQSYGLHLFAPVKASIPDVVLIGIFRLRHAPRTAATREWGASIDEWRCWVAHYEELGGGVGSAGSAISRGDQG